MKRPCQPVNWDRGRKSVKFGKWLWRQSEDWWLLKQAWIPNLKWPLPLQEESDITCLLGNDHLGNSSCPLYFRQDERASCYKECNIGLPSAAQQLQKDSSWREGNRNWLRCIHPKPSLAPSAHHPYPLSSIRGVGLSPKLKGTIAEQMWGCGEQPEPVHLLCMGAALFVAEDRMILWGGPNQRSFLGQDTLSGDVVLPKTLVHP